MKQSYTITYAFTVNSHHGKAKSRKGTVNVVKTMINKSELEYDSVCKSFIGHEYLEPGTCDQRNCDKVRAEVETSIRKDSCRKHIVTDPEVGCNCIQVNY